MGRAAAVLSRRRARPRRVALAGVLARVVRAAADDGAGPADVRRTSLFARARADPGGVRRSSGSRCRCAVARRCSGRRDRVRRARRRSPTLAGLDVARELREARAPRRRSASGSSRCSSAVLGRARRAASSRSSTRSRSGAGRRRTIVDRAARGLRRALVRVPVPASGGACQLGLPDLLFFALFLAAAPLEPACRATWVAMTALVRRHDGARRRRPVRLGGLPALPLLSVAFLRANADLLWRASDAAGARRRRDAASHSRPVADAPRHSSSTSTGSRASTSTRRGSGGDDLLVSASLVARCSATRVGPSGAAPPGWRWTSSSSGVTLAARPSLAASTAARPAPADCAPSAFADRGRRPRSGARPTPGSDLPAARPRRVAPRRREPLAAIARAARPSRRAACAGTCRPAARARAGSPSPRASCFDVARERRRVARDVDDPRRAEPAEPAQRLAREARARRVDDDDVGRPGALAQLLERPGRRCRRRRRRS